MKFIDNIKRRMLPDSHCAGLLKGLLTALALMAGSVAMAQTAEQNGIAQLRQFVAATRSATGTFKQTVHAASGRQPQQASGRFAFQRPGKFRWEYEQPYPQLLVSDGKTLWSWDPDLNQATVNKLDAALGNTPAAILSGGGMVEDNFQLTEAGASDGLSWVQAIPLQPDSSFESMRMGFSGGMLQRMELRDNFGQMTQIIFSGVAADVTLDAKTFRFDMPAGADVIGE